MTLGVAGMDLGDDGMANGCKYGVRITPVELWASCAARRSQWPEERCVSFREARAEGGGEREEAEEAVTGSSGTRGAG
jgi:hypothetical protein